MQGLYCTRGLKPKVDSLSFFIAKRAMMINLNLSLNFV